MNYQNNYGYNQPNTNNNAICWVQGEAGARAWIIAPNNTVLLMDSEGKRFYIKSADTSGMPTLRTFEYTEVTTQTPEVINRNELDSILARLDALEKENTPKTTKRAKVEDE